MPQSLELLMEAERRGILPPDKSSVLAEARRRGLVPTGSADPRRAQQPPQQDSAAARFLSGVGSALDPRPLAEMAVETGREAVTGRGSSMVTGMIQAQVDQFRKAREALGEGRFSETFGHALAGLSLLSVPERQRWLKGSAQVTWLVD